MKYLTIVMIFTMVSCNGGSDGNKFDRMDFGNVEGKSRAEIRGLLKTEPTVLDPHYSGIIPDYAIKGNETMTYFADFPINGKIFRVEFYRETDIAIRGFFLRTPNSKAPGNTEKQEEVFGAPQ